MYEWDVFSACTSNIIKLLEIFTFIQLTFPHSTAPVNKMLEIAKHSVYSQ